MINSNKVGIFFIGLFILITGCENDPLELTPSNGQTLSYTVFTLSAESETIQGSVLIGSSKTLYAGNIGDDKLSAILLSLDYDNLQEHPICFYGEDSLKNIENIQIELKSLDPLLSLDTLLSLSEVALNPGLILFDEANISIGLSSVNPWSEESNLADADFSDIDWGIDTFLQSISFTENTLQISISDPSILRDWCELQNQYIIIKYEPELTADKLKLLKFHSSDLSIISYRPQINFDYSLLQVTNNPTNKFLVGVTTDAEGSLDTLGISSELESESSVHIVDNPESESWSRIYLLNVDPTDDFSPLEDVFLNESIVTYDLDFNDEPVITSEMVEVETKILTLTIQLNGDIIDSIDTFGLSILDDSITAYAHATDLSGDTYDEFNNPDGTEMNGIWDEGEYFFDFGGIDQCPDQFESGDENYCIIEISEFENETCSSLDEGVNHVDCVYNPFGTEMNGTWDEGEYFFDFGIDQCPDQFESGDESYCIIEISEFENETCSSLDEGVNHVDCVYSHLEPGGLDPNHDTYNIDPAQDDYDEIENPSGTENNGIWEDGEPFFDIGCDGIPQIVDENDITDGNGSYDNCEPFNDTGTDGIYTGLDEEGPYSYNPSGSEGNLSYQIGELFDDYGVDNIEEGSDGDDASDNFNIDPNSDTYDEFNNPDGTEMNDIWDEGESFYDFGSDGISDADEVFSEVNFLNIGVGNDQYLNDYIIDKNMIEATPYPMPDLSTDDAVLWISNIKPTSEENQFELTFSIFAKKEIKSLSFSLTHIKLDWVVTTFVSQSFSSNDYTAKFVDDISVYEVDHIENDSELSLNYGHGITSKVYFENIDSSRTPIEISLGDFIDENRNVLLSDAYTQLVLPIDVENSTIDEFGANLVLSGVINEEVQSLISINISQDDERIIIPMSTLLQKYINGQYVDYAGFGLSLDGSKYNFSNIILADSSAYLEILHSQ